MRRSKAFMVATLFTGLAVAIAPPSAGAKEVPNCVGQIRRYEAQHLDPNLGQVVKSYATAFGSGYGQFVAGVAVSGESPAGVEPGCS
jgi:hypothetical protein